MNTQFLNTLIIDFPGTQYTTDSISTNIDIDNTYITVLNSDVIADLPYELPVLEDACIAGNTYPIIARINFNTENGFLINDTFRSIVNQVSL